MNDATTTCSATHHRDQQLPTAALLIKKHNKPESIRICAQHNLRERWVDPQNELTQDHISPRFTVLAGPSSSFEVAELARRRLHAAGIGKTRRNAVLAIEAVISLSPDHGVDHLAFFATCTSWFDQHFGGPNLVISSVVHHDEEQDHAHLIIHPLVNGRLQGSALIGGKLQLRAIKTQLDRDVGHPHGIRVMAPLALTAQERLAAARDVELKLAEIHDPLLRSCLSQQVCRNIRSDPLPYMRSLGIDPRQYIPRLSQ